MKYSSHYTPSRQANGSSSKGASSKLLVGRVVKVLLNLDDPECTSARKFNAIIFRKIRTAADENSTKGLDIAYQGSVNSRMIPVEGEKVVLETRADGLYWIDIIPEYNHPHYNAAPDTKQDDWQNNLEQNFKQLADINPLQANPGDFLIEGRYGQSIRIGGGKGKSNPIIDNSNEGKPIILISNGQIKTDNGNDVIREDINEDPNSLYFVADHKIPLQAANSKRDSYETVPTAFDQYKGNQVILNGGRLVLNAKDDSILLSAKESIGLNSKTINLDAEEYMCVDANKIYIGKKARTAGKGMEEPVVLGRQLGTWLITLLDSLSMLSTALTTATAVPAGSIASLNTIGPTLKATVDILSSQTGSFQSHKVFTE